MTQEKTLEISEDLKSDFATKARANVSSAHGYPPAAALSPRDHLMLVPPNWRRTSETGPTTSVTGSVRNVRSAAQSGGEADMWEGPDRATSRDWPPVAGKLVVRSAKPQLRPADEVRLAAPAAKTISRSFEPTPPEPGTLRRQESNVSYLAIKDDARRLSQRLQSGDHGSRQLCGRHRTEDKKHGTDGR